MHHMYTGRGIWKIASVFVAMILPVPEKHRPRKKRRYYALPLTDAEQTFMAKFRRIMQALKDGEHGNQ